MRIELLYFDGCPNHADAFDVLSRALDELGVRDTILRIHVEGDRDAITKRFLGSPSIRIDGRDIEIDDETRAEYSMRCRRYRDGDRIVGCPPRFLVTTAIQRALGST